MPLAAGKCNSGIKVVSLDGQKYVQRSYEKQWWAEPKATFDHHVQMLADVGLVEGAGNWVYKDCGDQIEISNPFLDLVPHDKVPKNVLNAAYEVLLDKVKALHAAHGVFITDAHSDNIVPVRLATGEMQMLVVDGKAAGVDEDYNLAWRRLGVKLKHEKEPAHRWFLCKYLDFLEGLWVAESGSLVL